MEIILPILLTLSLLFGRFDYTKTEEFQTIITNVEYWRPLIEEVKKDDSRENVPTDLVLAVIAQESKGHPQIISGDKYKSVGLMQVIPRSWVGTTEQLMNPRFNIEWGLWFLEKGLEYCNGSEWCALRVYNCGPVKAGVQPDQRGFYDIYSYCGGYYADNVIQFWRPYFYKSPVHQSRIIFRRHIE